MKFFLSLLIIISFIISYNNLYSKDNSNKIEKKVNTKSKLIKKNNTKKSKTVSSDEVENGIKNLEEPEKRVRTIGERKDPFFAGCLSLFMPGTGQFYAEKYQSGAIFVGIDVLSKGTMLGLFFYLRDKYTSDTKKDNTVEWNELSGSDRSITLTFLMFYISFLFYNVYDAVSSVHDYNSRYFEEFPVSMSFNNDLNRLSVNYTIRF